MVIWNLLPDSALLGNSLDEVCCCFLGPLLRLLLVQTDAVLAYDTFLMVKQGKNCE